jgi:PhnB protein
MIEPYIMFNGQASAAIDFYEKVFPGANKRVMRRGDAPGNAGDCPVDAMKKDRVLHGEIELCGTNFSVSDCDQVFRTTHFMSLMVRLDTPEEVRRIYDELRADGGQVMMEIEPTFYAKMYAWVQDKFGVSRQLICD